MWRDEVQTEQSRRQAESERQQILSNGGSEETIEAARITRDRDGRIRDIKYSSGDVTSRQFNYDQNGDLKSVTIDSQTRGRSVWTNNGDSWRNNMGQAYTGTMAVLHKEGVFRFVDGQGKLKDYLTSGRPVDAQTRPDDRRDDRRIDPDRNRLPDPYRDKDLPPDPARDRRQERPQDRRPDPYRDRQTVPDGNREGDRPADKPKSKLDDAFHQTVATKSEYRNLMNEAAAKKQPLVMVFGRGDKMDQAMLDQIKAAKDASAGKANFVFVDLNKVDPESSLGKYALNDVEKQFGAPLTMVLNAKPGERVATPEMPVLHQAGAVSAEDIVVGIATARGGGKDNRSAAEKEPLKEIKDCLEQARKPELKTQEKYDLYKKAIETADKLGDKELAGITRAQLGLALIEWGGAQKTAGNGDKGNQLFEIGMQWIMEGGRRYPDLYKNEAFAGALKGSALEGKAADLLIEKGQMDPHWYRASDAELKADKDADVKKLSASLQELKDAMAKPKDKPEPLRRRDRNRPSDNYDFFGREKLA